MLRIPVLITALTLAGGDLSEKENAKLEAVVDRFIRLEMGKLPKSQEQEAKDELYRLGPEAIFALVDGFNRAAAVESSCATVTIGKKIESIVRSTNDIDLITYIRENLGTGLDKSGKRPLPVTNSLRNVQTTCLLRKGEILRKGLTVGQPKSQAASSMSMSELGKAASRERGEAHKKVLIEVERRQSTETPAILGKAASGADAEGRKLAKVLLLKYADKQSPTLLKTLLKHESAEVRAAAARTIGSKDLRYGDELIALLADEDAGVQQAAREALVQISGGMDFGPQPGASIGARNAAAQKWRQWWRALNVNGRW
jgi:HEAT repeats